MLEPDLNAKTQRRKDAKEIPFSSLRLCAFAFLSFIGD